MGRRLEVAFRRPRLPVPASDTTSPLHMETGRVPPLASSPSRPVIPAPADLIFAISDSYQFRISARGP
jgi:hypothetical protein